MTDPGTEQAAAEAPAVEPIPPAPESPEAPSPPARTKKRRTRTNSKDKSKPFVTRTILMLSVRQGEYVSAQAAAWEVAPLEYIRRLLDKDIEDKERDAGRTRGMVALGDRMAILENKMDRIEELLRKGGA